MFARIVLLFILLLANLSLRAEKFADRQLSLVATNYQLDYQLDLAETSLTASGKITVKNISTEVATHIPFRLYRMLKVSQITDDEGKPLKYSQNILSDEAWPVLQTNYLEIDLLEPIKPEESRTFSLQFNGYIRGYAETGWLYVKDSITPEFSLLRTDSFAYPIIGYPNETVNSQVLIMSHRFDYDVRISVPKPLIVANGGALISKTEDKNKQTFRYKNKLPAWRMDFAIAPYQLTEKGKYRIFSWEPENKVQPVLDEIVKTVDLYSQWFGPLATELGYTFIEVPEGFGAQADVTSVIQDATAFRGGEELTRIYHELSHQWNVKPLDQYSPRWNEGLATFLEDLTFDQLHQPGFLNESTESILKRLKNDFSQNDQYGQTGYLDFGKAGLNSYRVGSPFFRLIYDLIGEQKFNRVLAEYYRDYYQTGATTEQLIERFSIVSNNDLQRLFRDWAYTGEYVKIISNSKNYAELLARYK